MKKNFERDLIVKNLRCYKQDYWTEGSEVNFIAKPRIYNGLLCLLDCEIDVEFSRGATFRAKRGDVLYLPRGSHYKITFCDVGAGVASFLFNFSLEVGGEAVLLSEKPTLAEFSDEAKKNALIEEVMQGDSSYFAKKSALFGLLALWKRTKDFEPLPNVNTNMKLLMPALNYMEARRSWTETVGELAEICHVSDGFFRKVFRETFSVSPKEFMLKERLLRAKEMLESGEFNVQEVSEKLGFSSPTYFSRIFKKKIGVPPVSLINMCESQK